MKYCFFICFLLLLGCGSPLDEGYWKDYNRVADLNSDDGTARSFSIDFESLHQDIEMTFNAESLSRDADGKLSFSVRVAHPSQVEIHNNFQIRTNVCPTATNGNVYSEADQETLVSKSAVPLESVVTDLNRNLEDQYIYLTGSISGGVSVDIACSQIRL